MRPVKHLAVDADDAGGRVGGEGGDHLARPRDGGLVGREGAVDDGDLGGMDRHLAGEAAALGGACVSLEPGPVAEVGENGVDRGDASRGGSEEAERARQAERFEIGAVGPAILGRADIGGEILAAPGDAGEPRARPGIAGEGEHCRSGFRSDRQDSDAALSDAVARFERREVVAERYDIRAAGGFRQHDAVRSGTDDRGEIIEDHAGGERIDADEELGSAAGID